VADGHGGAVGHGVVFDPERHCGGKTRKGTPCTKTKGFGTDHVGVGSCKHHGGSTPTHQKAAAREQARIMGEAMDVEPHEALLSCVRITAGEVAYCSALVADLEKATESTMFGEVLNIWIQVRQKAVFALAKYSKMALDAGVAERQVQMAERYGQMLADLIGGILGDLDLTPAQQKKAPKVVRGHLQVLEGGAQAA
jgi:hypothetical protein